MTGDSRTELDNHADTCVVGKHSLILNDFDRPVNVTGYDESQGTVAHNMRTVTAAVAYDDPYTGKVVIIVIHQAILIPHLNVNLICPMQARVNDIGICDIPKFLAKNPTEHTHAVTFPKLKESDEFIIPLSLKGVTSFFPTRKPSKQEYDSAETVLELTYESPEWDPKSTMFEQQEESMMDSRGQVLTNDTVGPRGRMFMVSGLQTFAPTLPFDLYDCYGMAEDNLGMALESNRSVAGVGIARSENRGSLDPNKLAQTWGIGLEAAKRTIQATTQRGMRTVLHPSLSRRFRTNDRQLRYRRLPVELFTDTLISTVLSKRKNKCAQIFAHRNGWARAFPMANKSDAHEALSLLFARDGVPAALIMDGSKEQILGEFRKKAREAGCHVKQTEPYSPWSNAAEGCIRELKRGAARKMVKTKSPKVLWDDCLELEAYIRSNTAHDIYELKGEVPETLISGETSNITQFCDFAWYEWIYFRDTGESFPNDKEVLGRYLLPSIDVGPALTAKILKSNGQTVHRSTYRHLTDDEWKNPDEIKARADFDKAVAEKLGSGVTDSDFMSEPEAITPTYEPYLDESMDQMRRKSQQKCWTTTWAQKWYSREGTNC